MQNGGILPNWIELDPISIIVRGCPPKGMLFRKLKLLLVISDGQQEIQEKLDIFVGLSILHGIILFIQIFGTCAPPGPTRAQPRAASSPPFSTAAPWGVVLS